ncbi:MAG TPA: signal peptidase I [Methylomusa anaerophila]|uniref:Signal peptidase I n=1 Tax=Methylomusa anaerophila TaxID=1930071 RepID=A0A348AQ64_9FIRM|nr:signal peptidase I [Methylomusa anaerophila]BBB93212.1 signal peptidase I T [Methylomusa anaerophila]HML86956.1 signal peptidase I [Methylomusa anaerophila]
MEEESKTVKERTEKESDDKSLGDEIKDWVISILIAVVLAFFIRYYIVELYMVEGPSMRPTLVNGERLIVNKFIYRFKSPGKGEVVVFRYPRDPSRDFIKRVIAIPGDTIEIKDGRVFVNGQLQNETYILERTRDPYPLATVPEGQIFVMGDNRNNSEDSRSKNVGFVPVELLKGKAVTVFWPLDHIKTLP